jgi:hypothetical protein
MRFWDYGSMPQREGYKIEASVHRAPQQTAGTVAGRDPDKTQNQKNILNCRKKRRSTFSVGKAAGKRKERLWAKRP